MKYIKPVVYLDIDGVLLANDFNAAKHVHQFLEVVKQRASEVYWLTTHCKGDATTAYKRLQLVLEPKTMELLTDVRATNWDVAKTEAINFEKPFLWFDDDLFDDERSVLQKNNAIDCRYNVANIHSISRRKRCVSSV